MLASGRTLIVPDYSCYEHRIDTLRDYGFTATMSSPLIARGETIGVLTVEHTGTDLEFGDEDARLLTAFANHAAVALDNARRYENEVALARDLARANDELSRSLVLQRRLVEQVLADRGPPRRRGARTPARSPGGAPGPVPARHRGRVARQLR